MQRGPLRGSSDWSGAPRAPTGAVPDDHARARRRQTRELRLRQGGEVTAVFDWEMASIGDPLADIGWAEVLWVMPGSFNNVAGSRRWRSSSRAGRSAPASARSTAMVPRFQLYKMAVIGLVGARLFDDGHSDDLRFNDMAYGVPWLTSFALTDLGIEEELEPGPVFPRRSASPRYGRRRIALSCGLRASWVEHPFEGRADAAVDEDVGAGEVARVVGHEERDQIGHLARRTHARDRRVVEHHLHHRLLFELLA